MGVTMRGNDGICGSRVSYIDLEKRVRADHPLRVNEVNSGSLPAPVDSLAAIGADRKPCELGVSRRRTNRIRRRAPATTPALYTNTARWR
jgi:hypothetical protein